MTLDASSLQSACWQHHCLLLLARLETLKHTPCNQGCLGAQDSQICPPAPAAVLGTPERLWAPKQQRHLLCCQACLFPEYWGKHLMCGLAGLQAGQVCCRRGARPQQGRAIRLPRRGAACAQGKGRLRLPAGMMLGCRRNGTSLGYFWTANCMDGELSCYMAASGQL